MSDLIRLPAVRKRVRAGLLLAAVTVASGALIEQAAAWAPAQSSNPWFQKYVLQSNKPVVVKFGADWCGSCRKMDLALADLRRRFPKARFVRVDVEKRADVFAQFGTKEGIPQIAVFRKGKVVKRCVGYPGRKLIYEWLRDNI